MRNFFLLLFALLVAPLGSAAALRFEITADTNLISSPANGRLLVILDRLSPPEPRFSLHPGGTDAPFFLGRDASLAPGVKVVVDSKAIAFPSNNLSELPPADYHVQTLFMTNTDIRSPNSYGNLYSDVQDLRIDPAHSGKVKLKLTHRVPDEQVPADTEMMKFIKIPSPVLSKFHGHPMFLRAGILLPRDYANHPLRKYPLWVRIGGWGTRYTFIEALMDDHAEFKRLWMSNSTPEMILLQLDGAGPYGDPYQVNSANNGPYGDAVVDELIPYVEQKFRAIAQPRARVLSGASTGGWVSLALQVFYPDFFNGTWTSCPDPVDFRALELTDIYKDKNTYVNQHGCERPSRRDVNGDISLYMRREVQFENVLGNGNSWTMSGKDWSAWNAVFSPRGADGRPLPLWDPQSGKIDRAVAEQWKKYDLRLVMQKDWKTLGPKLQGKLHISVGDADNYFLNNAVHLLDDFLSRANPPYQGRIVYGPRQGHGWSDVTTAQMFKEMEAATGGPVD